MRDLGVRNRNQLFEYFLIDVDMNPCMLTSRIRQATGAVQTFFQRCLMNLEPQGAAARSSTTATGSGSRTTGCGKPTGKSSCIPENWIEPELRDDKSPLFQALERTILQQEIKNDNVEAAFADYLEGLDEIARLDVRGVWFEERQTHRMVARPAPQRAAHPGRRRGRSGTTARTTSSRAPSTRRTSGTTAGSRTAAHWTPWEKIDADIEGDHLVPVVFKRRMHLFWTMFREVQQAAAADEAGTARHRRRALGKDWEISARLLGLRPRPLVAQADVARRRASTS